MVSMHIRRPLTGTRRRRRCSSGGGGLILALALIIGFCMTISFRTVGGHATSTVLWYVDATTREFVTVPSSVKLSTRTVEQAGTLLELLKTPPEGKDLATDIPGGLSVRQATVFPGGVLHVTLRIAQDQRPLGYAEEERAYWQLVNSFLTLPSVHSVELAVEGRTAGTFLLFVKTEREFTACTSMPDDGEPVDLYFVTADGRYAVESRTVPSGLTRTQTALQIVRSLLSGPVHPSLTTPLPESSILRGVTVDGGTATVDFDTQLWNLTVGPERERQIIDTLVLSLTRLPGVDRVRFTVGGNAVASLFGTCDTSAPLYRLSGGEESGACIAVYHLTTIDGDRLPVLTVYQQERPLAGRNAFIGRAVSLLASPASGDSTLLGKGTALTSMLLDPETGILRLSLHLPSLPEDRRTSALLVDQLRLTLTEIPSVTGLQLTVNGASSFLPGGYYIGSAFQR